MNKKAKLLRVMMGLLIITLSYILNQNTAMAEKKNVSTDTKYVSTDIKNISATISADTVVKGKTIQIISKTKGVTYASSDNTKAFVSKDGVIIGKARGVVDISVMKKGYTTKTFTIRVTSAGKMPNITVSIGELELVNEKIKDSIYSVSIKNNGTRTVTKAKYYYTVTMTEDILSDDGVIVDTITTQEKVSFTTGYIKAGKTTKEYQLIAPTSGKIEDIKLTYVKIYSGNSLVTYDVLKNKCKLAWGVEDITPPVISGLVEENSYFGNAVYMVIYKDKKYDFSRYVTVYDDRDNDLTLTVDTSKVDYDKDGIYTVTYSAEDNAGNIGTATGKVEVRVAKKIDKMADEVLSKVVKASMTDKEKIKAIYTYVRKNYSYVDHSDKTSWEDMAEYGLRYKSGDCFVFYSVAKLLLTRTGIPNIEVTRFGGEGRHWWNLIYVDEGWYHYDTSPRKIQATFCMVTDEQLTEYSKSSGNSHTWDSSKYPVTATKKISLVEMGKRY